MELPDEINEHDRRRIEVAFSLLADGPLPITEVLPAVLAHSDDLPDETEDIDDDEVAQWVLDGITDSDLFWIVHPDSPDGVPLIARLDLMVDGRVFTTRLTDDDIATGSIELGADLTAIDWPISYGEAITLNGAPAERRFDATTGRTDLTALPGWLDEFTAGDLVALSWDAGTIRLAAADELGDGEREADAIAAYGNSIDEALGFELYQPLFNQLAVDPEAYRSPVPPLTELLAARGFDTSGDWFGRAGSEWEPPGKAAARQKRERIADMLDFDDQCRSFMDSVISAYYEHSSMLFRTERIAEGAELGDVPFDVDYRSVVNMLAYRTVADGFYLWVEDHAADEHLIDFLQTLAATQRAGSAAAHYLLGRLYDDVADFEMATGAYQRALATDADYRIPLYHLGWIEFDRGNFDLARRHHRDAGFPADHQLFDHYPAATEPVGAEVGRNDPCPCGSGRKFKACHQRVAAAATPPGSAWERLQMKLTRFSIHVDRLHTALTLALTAADADIERTKVLLSDAFIIDVALFEAGLLEEFLDARGPLLAADEVAIAEAVDAEQRDLFEVIAVEPGTSATVRSVTAGSEIRVVERLASQGLQVGEYLLGRVVPDPPDADGPGFFGHMQQVPMRGRASLLEVLDNTEHGDHDGGHGLAYWYGALTGPPTLTTREGEPLERWTADLVVDADIESVIRFVETFAERDDDRWHEFYELGSSRADSGDGGELRLERILRATIFIDELGVEDLGDAERGNGELDASGTSVVIEAMALARVERALERLRGAFDVEVLSLESDDPLTVDDIERLSPWSDDAIDSPGADLGNEEREILDRYMREYEQKWLDDSIPALGGLTPRQALDDPTRRGDLVRLIDSFPPLPPGASGMDPDRLRQALGLD